MKWFDVGPGEGGIEFPLMLVVCSVACILAYLPPRTRSEGAQPSATSAARSRA
jgi:hypothetical protein